MKGFLIFDFRLPIGGFENPVVYRRGAEGAENTK
jgi:hypothetical protein